MKHIVGLGVSLLVFWLVMSGVYTGLIITLGVVSVLLVLLVVHRMDIHDHETFPIHLTRGIFGYWSWLAREVFKANIDVARIVLSRDMRLSPRIIRVRSSQRTDLGHVIFANSITLTPGTVSVEIEGDEIIVHALTEELAEGVLNGEMDRRVLAIEAS